MTFDPCEDCGSPLISVVMFALLVWATPIAVAIARRHNVDDVTRERRLIRAQFWTTCVAVILTVWYVFR